MNIAAALGFAGLVVGAAIHRVKEDYALLFDGGLASPSPDMSLPQQACVVPQENPRPTRCPGGDRGWIIICSTVREIPINAFHGCAALTRVTFHGSIETIRAGAFGQTGLSGEVYLPMAQRSVTVADDAFPRGVTLKFLGDPTPAPAPPAQNTPSLTPPPPDPLGDVVTTSGSVSGVVGASPIASATGDPHVSSLAGEHFDINQPAEHVLLRVPLDPDRPPQLEVLGQIVAEPEKVCAMYIKMMSLHGEWLGNATVQVRPLRRSEPGSNTAGTGTAWPFSLREVTPAATGGWRSVADFRAGGGAVERLSEFAGVAARVKSEEFGRGPEAQAFEFLVGDGLEASIVVSQGQHQALNVQMKNLQALGQARLGGLLGTEKHHRDLEEPTMECKASKASSPMSFALGVSISTSASASSSRLSASW